MGQHSLSRSSFLKGIQCDKQLYLYKYHYDWMDTLSQNQQAEFDQYLNFRLKNDRLKIKEGRVASIAFERYTIISIMFWK